MKFSNYAIVGSGLCSIVVGLPLIVLVKDFKGRRNNQIPGDGGPECPTDYDEYPNLHNRDKWGF